MFLSKVIAKGCIYFLYGYGENVVYGIAVVLRLSMGFVQDHAFLRKKYLKYHCCNIDLRSASFHSMIWWLSLALHLFSYRGPTGMLHLVFVCVTVCM